MSGLSVDPETLRLMFPDVLFTLAAATLVAYDILISIEREVTNIYRRRFSMVTILYALNRVAAVTLVVAQVLSNIGPESIMSCDIMYFLQHGSVVALLLILGTISSLRVYAIWDRRWFPASIIFCVFLIPVVINLWYIPIYKAIGVDLDIPHYAVCFWAERTPVSDQSITGWTLASRITIIFADALVLIATWAKTYRIRFGLDGSSRSPAVDVLLVDGSLYFGAQLILGIIGAIFNAQAGPALLACIVSYIYMPLASVLTSRFLLSLRNMDEACKYEDDEPSKIHSGIHFVIGNIGSALASSDDSLDSEQSFSTVIDIGVMIRKAEQV